MIKIYSHSKSYISWELNAGYVQKYLYQLYKKVSELMKFIQYVDDSKSTEI